MALSARAATIVSDGSELRAALLNEGGDIELANDIDLAGGEAEVRRDAVVRGNGHAVKTWAGLGFFTVAPDTSLVLQDMYTGRSGAPTSQPTRAAGARRRSRFC